MNRRALAIFGVGAALLAVGIARIPELLARRAVRGAQDWYTRGRGV